MEMTNEEKMRLYVCCTANVDESGFVIIIIIYTSPSKLILCYITKNYEEYANH